MVTDLAAPPNGSAPASPVQPPLDAPDSSALHEDPINILIVDDEQKNLIVLETILDDPSYRLVRAESADQALLALVAREFALLILDIRLPGMTGFELAQMIKERKKTARVPIIFLTAYYNEDQHVLEGYGSGAVDYLQKPVNPAILRSKVAIFADLYRKSREVNAANRALLAEVTERRRAEARLLELNETLEERVSERTKALQESDRRKDEFLAMLAHELRNPLAPVRNAVQILHMKAPAAPELQHAKEIIDRQMQTMSRLISDLMDVSRISRGKIELRRERLELARVIHDAIEASRPLIDQEGHILTVTLPPQTILLDADLVRLPQVFLNLLTNAAKFSDPGGRIDLMAERHGDDVVVSVKDAGVGIPAADLASVFEMFAQVEGALSKSQGGMGIGLYLVKRLVEMHDGEIEVRSEGPGKGSEFRVRLPIVGQPSPSDEKSADGHEKSAQSSQLRILVADDNKDAAISLMILLEHLGHIVRVGHDGESAVEIAREFQPEIALLDIGMPKMNGYEAALAIRQTPGGESIVLVAVTGWGQDDDKKKARDAGFNQHMVKPVDPDVLIKLLQEISIDRSSNLSAL